MAMLPAGWGQSPQETQSPISPCGIRLRTRVSQVSGPFLGKPFLGRFLELKVGTPWKSIGTEGARETLLPEPL